MKRPGLMRRISGLRASARAAMAIGLSAVLAIGPRALALGPLQRNHPVVERGLKAYESGRYDEALQAFDDAKRELPSSAALEFNRGNALYKLGRRDEAKDAYHRVSEAERSDLREKDYYNLGNVWAEMGNAKEAISAYRKALTLDPKDEDARHNLEVMLRNLPPPQSKPDAGAAGPPDAGPPDGGDGGKPPDGGGDGGADAGDAGLDGGQSRGGGDGGRGDAGSDAGKSDEQDRQGEPREDGGTDAGAEEAEQGGVDGGSLGEAKLSKEEAERMLDSMKQTEKNLQLWRFQQRKPRKQNEKDW
jgi:tetratricopeptide (TPR) repeat protein